MQKIDFHTKDFYHMNANGSSITTTATSEWFSIIESNVVNLEWLGSEEMITGKRELPCVLSILVSHFLDFQSIYFNFFLHPTLYFQYKTIEFEQFLYPYWAQVIHLNNDRRFNCFNRWQT